MVAKRHELETKSIDTRQRKTSYIVSMDSLKTREFLERDNKKKRSDNRSQFLKMVGVRGFEPPTPTSRT